MIGWMAAFGVPETEDGRNILMTTTWTIVMWVAFGILFFGLGRLERWLRARPKRTHHDVVVPSRVEIDDPAREYACPVCKDTGVRMVPQPKRPDILDRVRCACGQGCGAEAITGQACTLPKVGHAGSHSDGRGLEWSVDYRTEDRAEWIAWDVERGWVVQDVGWQKATPPKLARHVCNVEACLANEGLLRMGRRFAVWCESEKRWTDMTDVVVRRFVMPYEPHAVSVAEAG